ncbi:MAG: polysaccharide biosynthesis protein [Actinomycetaceae bacterium]|nr:polysaccharide biosynthesis protein [Actinomycetaceae bacterium]
MFGNSLLVRTTALVIWDVLAWIAASMIVSGLRYSWDLSRVDWVAIIVYTAIAMFIFFGIGFATKLHIAKFRIGSFEESLWLSSTVFVSAVVSLAISWFFPPGDTFVPIIYAVTLPFLVIVLVLSGRAGFRVLKNYMRRGSPEAKPTLLVGAGTLAYQIIRLVEDDPNSAYDIVGMVDDAPNKRHLHLGSVRVLGTLEDIPHIVRKHNVAQVLLAISNADRKLVNRVSELTGGATGPELLVMPPLSEMAGRSTDLRSMRKINIMDVLGRGQVQTDLSQIAGYINGKRVLVTGAGGSIGSEICRQVHKLGPQELIMLDRDESALHGISLDIYNNALLNTPDIVLNDIRDYEALRKVFETHRPHVVFHTAALKHLPMLEQYPEEGWKTNVFGTLNLLRLAKEFNVDRFVNISTDKAANPTTVLGRTKRLAERLTVYFAKESTGKFLSVRFGNVLGSRGSMLWTFQKQIDEGGPITVTHPDVERYFMTIPEACALVIQAGAIGRDGEVLVLDMGEPVKILDVAKKMIALQNRPIDIVFTGLRPGEKMTEVLVNEGDTEERPFHPLISHSTVDEIAPEDLEGIKTETLASELDAYKRGAGVTADQVQGGV